MQRKIIYLINPISGNKGKQLLLKTIEVKTRQQNVAFEMLHTNAAGEYNFLRDKIINEQITDVVICGGDGTVNQVASALINIDVNIGIIPMGSGNGLALTARISKNVNQALNIIFNGKASYIDSFLINEKFSCMLCGLGFDAQVAHDFAKQSKRGLITYIKECCKNFIKAKPYQFQIVNKDKSFSVDAFFVSIANSNQFGNQVTIAPRASLNDGLLDIVIVKKMNKLRLLWALLMQILTGQVMHLEEKRFYQKDIIYFQTDRFYIKNICNAPLHIDGEPIDTNKEFKIEIISNAFKLIQPS